VPSAFHRHFLLFRSTHILHTRSAIFFGCDHPHMFYKISEIRSLSNTYEIKLDSSDEIYS